MLGRNLGRTKASEPARPRRSPLSWVSESGIPVTVTSFQIDCTIEPPPDDAIDVIDTPACGTNEPAAPELLCFCFHAGALLSIYWPLDRLI